MMEKTSIHPAPATTWPQHPVSLIFSSIDTVSKQFQHDYHCTGVRIAKEFYVVRYIDFFVT